MVFECTRSFSSIFHRKICQAHGYAAIASGHGLLGEDGQSFGGEAGGRVDLPACQGGKHHDNWGWGVSSRKEVHFPGTSTGLPVDMISTFSDIDAGIHCDLSEISVC